MLIVGTSTFADRPPVPLATARSSDSLADRGWSEVEREEEKVVGDDFWRKENLDGEGEAMVEGVVEGEDEGADEGDFLDRRMMGMCLFDKG